MGAVQTAIPTFESVWAALCETLFTQPAS